MPVQSGVLAVKTCQTSGRRFQRTRCMQVIRPKLLLEGFEHVAANDLAVTDDVSIIEAMGLPVKITPGSYTNIKVSSRQCWRHSPCCPYGLGQGVLYQMGVAAACSIGGVIRTCAKPVHMPC